MRMFRLFLLTLFLIPITSIAQERTFNQKVYVLSGTNLERYENLEQDCAWAAPFVPTEIVGGGVLELHTVVPNKKRGFLKAGGEQVGVIWVCVGSIEPREDPAIGLVPERTVAFAITLGGTTYGALGSWSPKTGPDVPEPGMAGWGGGAVVVTLTEDDQPGQTVGTMFYSLLDNLEDIPGYREDTIYILRLFEPRNADLESSAAGLTNLYN